MRLRLAVLVIPALLLAQSAPKLARSTPKLVPKIAPRRLLVISVAGLDARLLADSPARVKIPNIRKLIRQGTAASGVIGVAPSDTWSSGSFACNRSVHPVKKAPRCWQAASKSGLRTGAVYWPGTTGAEIAFDFPAARESQRKTDTQFDSVAQKASPAGIVDRIEAASPGFQKELWDDTSAARAAEYLLRVEKPDLLLVELTDVDAEQRETGALSVYARDALANDDDLIGRTTRRRSRGHRRGHWSPGTASRARTTS